jgi:formate dehydrogenase subunit gamma
MRGLFPTVRSALLALACAMAGAAFAQQQQQQPSPPPAQAAPPAGFVAPAEPKPDESNAVRAKTQPGNNAPFWRGVRDSGSDPGYTSLPGAEKGILIQPFVQYPGSRFTTAGEAWRQVRNDWIIPYGGALFVIALVAIGIFYFARGPIGHADNQGARAIERFTPFERAAHWTNAIAFVILAISGLVMAFGKFVLLPIMGATLFGGLTYLLKTLHNFAGALFAVSLVIVFFTFLRDNWPQRGDGLWLKRAGGMFSGEHVPSHRFNAGEKLIFWGGVLVLGGFTVGSGLVLDKLIPGLEYTRGQMQIAHMIHATATVLMMCLFAGHIYLGTVGTRGAFKAMRHGYVSPAWAEEHHGYWAEKIRAGEIPAQRSADMPPPPARQERVA